MHSRLRSFFAPPTFADPERTRQARILHFAFMFFGAVMAPILILLSWKFQNWLRIGVTLGLYVLFFAFSKAGRFHAAAVGLLLTLFFFIATGGLVFGGLSSISYMLGGAAFLVSAALLYGAKGAGFAACALFVLGVFFALFPAPSRSMASPAANLVMITLVFLFITGLLNYSFLLTRKARQETQAAVEALKDSMGKLRLAEWRLALTLEGSRVATWEWEPANGGMRWSDGAGEILRLGGGEVPSQFDQLMERVIPESRGEVTGAFREVGLESGRALHVEAWFRRTDGGQSWLEFRGRRPGEIHGAAQPVMGTVVDATPRRHAAEALSQREVRFRSMVTGLPAGIVEYDGEGKVTHANPAALEILGLSLEELDGREAIPPAWRCIGQEGNVEAGPGDWGKRCLEKEGSLQGEILGIWKARRGDFGWVLVHVAPLRAASGRATGALAHLADITRHRRTEQTRRETEAHWLDVITRVPDHILLCDREGRVVFYNHHAASGPQRSVLHRSLHDLADHRERPQLHEALEAVFEKGMAFETTQTLVFHAEPAARYALSLSPVRREGVVRTAFLVARRVPVPAAPGEKGQSV